MKLPQKCTRVLNPSVGMVLWCVWVCADATFPCIRHVQSTRNANGMNIHAINYYGKLKCFWYAFKHRRKLETLNVYSKIELMGFPHRRMKWWWWCSYKKETKWKPQGFCRIQRSPFPLLPVFTERFLPKLCRQRRINLFVCRSDVCSRHQWSRNRPKTHSPQLFRLSFNRFVKMEHDVAARKYLIISPKAKKWSRNLHRSQN